MFELLFFGMYAFVLIAAAIGVITSRNPVHSAMFLVLAFFSSAVLWLLLEAEFLAMTLVLVYVGAVMVLFLFVIMMLDINMDSLRTGYMRYAPVGIIVAVVSVAQLWSVFWLRSGGCRLMHSRRMTHLISVIPRNSVRFCIPSMSMPLSSRHSSCCWRLLRLLR